MNGDATNKAHYSQDLIAKTTEIWQPHSEATLTTQDAIEIIDNITALFDLLLELQEKYGKA